MTVRVFSGARITLDEGTLDTFRTGGLLNGAFTIVATFKRSGSTTDGTQYIVSFNSSGGVRGGLSFTSASLMQLDVGGVARTFAGAITNDVWYTAVCRKNSGTATPQINLYNHTAGTWSGWINGSGTLDNDSTAIDEVQLGNRPNDFPLNGKIAGVAAYSTAMLDAVASSMPYSFMYRLAGFPVAMWVLTQASTATAVTDLVGDADQTALSGTSVDGADDPATLRMTLRNLILRDYADASFATANSKSTDDLDWTASGDRVVVLAGIEHSSDGFTPADPTATGLTFAEMTGSPVGGSGDFTEEHGWTATASGDGNSTVTLTSTFTSRSFGMGAWAFSNVDSIQNAVTSTAAVTGGSVPLSMTVQEGASVVLIIGDWNATNDVVVTPSPADGIVRRAEFVSGRATYFIVEWHDQPAGTRNYGITGFGTDNSNVSRMGAEVRTTTGGGATDVTPNDSAHAQTADQPTLTQTHAVAAADALHGQAAEQPALTQVHQIAVDSATHAQTAEQPGVVTVHVLAPSDAVHAQAADSPTLTQVHVLAPADAGHAQTADQPAITQAHALAPSDAAHAQTAEAPALTQTHAIAANDAAHAQAADAPALTQVHAITTNDATHSQTADAPFLTQVHALTANDAAHAQAAEQPDLSLEGGIVVHSANHAQTADSPTLTQTHSLAPADAAHAQTADNAQLTTTYAIAPSDALHSQAAESPAIDGAASISVNSATHSHTADSPALTQLHLILVNSALHSQTADSPLLNAPSVAAYAVAAILESFDGGPASASLPSIGPASATLPVYE